MDDRIFKGNSDASKKTPETTDKKKFDKVITGTASTKKKTEAGKLKDLIFSDDVPDMKTYILMDVILPGIKGAIYDIGHHFLGAICDEPDRRRRDLGRDGRRYASSIGSGVRTVNERDRDYDRERRVRRAYDYEEVIVETKSAALEVLDQMDDSIDTYGYVSVADMYDMVGLTGEPNDNNFGWKNISSAKPERLRDGTYVISLPKPLPLDRRR